MVQDDGGQWHLFYTGTSAAENAMYQRIGHATSDDMHNWTRVGDGLCLDITGDNAKYYEADHMVSFWHDRAMRDPWVMRDPEGEGWLMYFQPAPQISPRQTQVARLDLQISPDLVNWRLEPLFLLWLWPA